MRPVSRSAVRWAAICALAACAAWPALADEPPDILVVDRERVLNASAAAERLSAEERAARSELRDELDALRAALEAEEAEIAGLRETAPREVFEARVRGFDARVREARETSQKKGEALQARFVSARRALSAALDPILEDMLKRTGAELILDARTVLAAAKSVDVTDEVLRRFDEQTDVALPPPEPMEE